MMLPPCLSCTYTMRLGWKRLDQSHMWYTCPGGRRISLLQCGTLEGFHTRLPDAAK